MVGSISKLPKLAPLTRELSEIFTESGYHDAILFGHARDGNLHLLFSQSFEVPSEIDRYRQMMDRMCHVVAHKYHGSLKAEHGTGTGLN